MSRHPLAKFVNKWSRKLHRWGSLAVAIPLTLVICTGLLLQVKKQSAWVQPAEIRGTGTVPAITLDRILDAARSAPEAQIETWDDINRLDVRPSKGLVKVRAQNDWEVQIDLGTGDVLQIAYRRSDLIESLHDGSFFGDWVKLWVFLPAGLILLGLLVTGMYLWWLPIGAKRKGRKKRAVSA